MSAESYSKMFEFLEGREQDLEREINHLKGFLSTYFPKATPSAARTLKLRALMHAPAYYAIEKIYGEDRLMHTLWCINQEQRVEHPTPLLLAGAEALSVKVQADLSKGLLKANESMRDVVHVITTSRMNGYVTQGPDGPDRVTELGRKYYERYLTELRKVFYLAQQSGYVPPDLTWRDVAPRAVF